jgi:two-component sensor histidine kinase
MVRTHTNTGFNSAQPWPFRGILTTPLAVGEIAVRSEVAKSNWKLSVADNGIGAPVGVFAQAKSGLGTSIVNALAQQLDARVEVLSGAGGTTVSVSHATFRGVA